MRYLSPVKPLPADTYGSGPYGMQDTPEKSVFANVPGVTIAPTTYVMDSQAGVQEGEELADFLRRLLSPDSAAPGGPDTPTWVWWALGAGLVWLIFFR